MKKILWLALLATLVTFYSPTIALLAQEAFYETTEIEVPVEGEAYDEGDIRMDVYEASDEDTDTLKDEATETGDLADETITDAEAPTDEIVMETGDDLTRDSETPADIEEFIETPPSDDALTEKPSEEVEKADDDFLSYTADAPDATDSTGMFESAETIITVSEVEGTEDSDDMTLAIGIGGGGLAIIAGLVFLKMRRNRKKRINDAAEKALEGIGTAKDDGLGAVKKLHNHSDAPLNFKVNLERFGKDLETAIKNTEKLSSDEKIAKQAEALEAYRMAVDTTLKTLDSDTRERLADDVDAVSKALRNIAVETDAAKVNMTAARGKKLPEAPDILKTLSLSPEPPEIARITNLKSPEVELRVIQSEFTRTIESHEKDASFRLSAAEILLNRAISAATGINKKVGKQVAEILAKYHQTKDPDLPGEQQKLLQTASEEIAKAMKKLGTPGKKVHLRKGRQRKIDGVFEGLKSASAQIEHARTNLGISTDAANRQLEIRLSLLQNKTVTQEDAYAFTKPLKPTEDAPPPRPLPSAPPAEPTRSTVAVVDDLELRFAELKGETDEAMANRLDITVEEVKTAKERLAATDTTRELSKPMSKKERKALAKRQNLKNKLTKNPDDVEFNLRIRSLRGDDEPTREFRAGLYAETIKALKNVDPAATPPKQFDALASLAKKLSARKLKIEVVAKSLEEVEAMRKVLSVAELSDLEGNKKDLIAFVREVLDSTEITQLKKRPNFRIFRVKETVLAQKVRSILLADAKIAFNNAISLKNRNFQLEITLTALKKKLSKAREWLGDTPKNIFEIAEMQKLVQKQITTETTPIRSKTLQALSERLSEHTVRATLLAHVQDNLVRTTNPAERTQLKNLASDLGNRNIRLAQITTSDKARTSLVKKLTAGDAFKFAGDPEAAALVKIARGEQPRELFPAPATSPAKAAADASKKLKSVKAAAEKDYKPITVKTDENLTPANLAKYNLTIKEIAGLKAQQEHLFKAMAAAEPAAAPEAWARMMDESKRIVAHIQRQRSIDPATEQSILIRKAEEKLQEIIGKDHKISDAARTEITRVIRQDMQNEAENLRAIKILSEMTASILRLPADADFRQNVTEQIKEMDNSARAHKILVDTQEKYLSVFMKLPPKEQLAISKKMAAVTVTITTKRPKPAAPAAPKRLKKPTLRPAEVSLYAGIPIKELKKRLHGEVMMAKQTTIIASRQKGPKPDALKKLAEIRNRAIQVETLRLTKLTTRIQKLQDEGKSASTLATLQQRIGLLKKSQRKLKQAISQSGKRLRKSSRRNAKPR